MGMGGKAMDGREGVRDEDGLWAEMLVEEEDARREAAFADPRWWAANGRPLWSWSGRADSWDGFMEALVTVREAAGRFAAISSWWRSDMWSAVVDGFSVTGSETDAVESAESGAARLAAALEAFPDLAEDRLEAWESMKIGRKAEDGHGS